MKAAGQNESEGLKGCGGRLRCPSMPTSLALKRRGGRPSTPKGVALTRLTAARHDAEGAAMSADQGRRTVAGGCSGVGFREKAGLVGPGFGCGQGYGRGCESHVRTNLALRCGWRRPPAARPPPITIDTQHEWRLVVVSCRGDLSSAGDQVGADVGLWRDRTGTGRGPGSVAGAEASRSRGETCVRFVLWADGGRDEDARGVDRDRRVPEPGSRDGAADRSAWSDANRAGAEGDGGGQVGDLSPLRLLRGRRPRGAPEHSPALARSFMPLAMASATPGCRCRSRRYRPEPLSTCCAAFRWRSLPGSTTATRRS